MADKNFSNTNETQFTISQELICLLQWLVECESKKLKSIINKALNSGLQSEMQITENQESLGMDEAQHVVVNFFSDLEQIMFEALSERATKQARKKNLLPAIEHIDSMACDDATIQFSVEKVSLKNDNAPEESIQELFFKEILRRWKPSKKNILN